MYHIPFILRRLLKSKSLRIINLLGLTLIFACILVSYTYIKRELSYDKFYSNAHRIARMTLSYENNTADGRIYGISAKQIWQDIPEIEDVLKLELVNTAILNHNGNKQVLSNLFFAGENLLNILDIPLIEGNSKEAFRSPESVIISERLALQLFGRTDIIGEKIELSSRRIESTVRFISGVFKNMPENTHFHSDVIIHKDDLDNSFYYTYLLLKDGYNLADIQSRLTTNFKSQNPDNGNAVISLMPMTDIHLHSHLLREMETNGNIYYIYLIAGINLLLLIIVLFNLWLNSSVIFSYNKRYYQLLRMNGASSSVVIKDEIWVSLLLAVISILAGKLLSAFIGNYFSIPFSTLSLGETIILALLFILFTIFVSLLPILINMSATIFLNEQADLRQSRFSISNVKYMLIVQYSIVLFIIIVGIGINSQMALIRNTQVAGNNDRILVFEEQPHEVIKNYTAFRDELLKHSEIESVTAAMQLPGIAVRDMIAITAQGKEPVYIPVLVVGEDFMQTFNIKPVAGTLFPPLRLSYAEEENLQQRKMYEEGFKPFHTDNIIVNRKALGQLGFSSPEEAIGKEVGIVHNSLDYFPTGIICGVVEDFTYTNVYEDAIPMVILQRNMFMNCFIIRIAPGRNEQALVTLNSVWATLNPDYPINYKFLSDSYKSLYMNELNAEKVVIFFSILSFIITILGLIIFMAFMIKNRMKEISIRKVNGATNSEIVFMLNFGLLRWIFLSFVIAMPAAWYVMDKWLENFAYKTTIYWWIFVLAGVSVFLVSFLAISWQSLRAARINPAKSLKGD
ncbi:ABC transporter permease [Dysgonomonas sp. GY75]|uniref:ABC transporter permease n=1 Tax=Dysgonomonas sp. GY75 TaxID=2780419 RepID=UPI0018836A74|nr:ABC transporter permease [Dysgonomonas sp. GY75]MBF0650950.1 ABC transporter permease [Dysgonomonas sp. GY75]